MPSIPCTYPGPVSNMPDAGPDWALDCICVQASSCPVFTL
jgi:hypothetical protein